MRIGVKNSDTNLRLRFPTGLVLNRLTVSILVHALRDKDFPFNKKQLMTLIKAAKTYKHHHPDWVLVEVDGHDGDQVMVKL
ncbi:MAG: hypothetical protein IJN58_00460 [Clostridia bacterium]|nr:hypothetical protein [Clostridia bacterium]